MKKINKKFIQKFFKRMRWRFFNLSFKQFLLEFVLRQFRTIELDELPQYKPENRFPGYDEIKLKKPHQFFVLIKPNGLWMQNIIKKYLQEYNLKIFEEKMISDFFSLSFYLFGTDRIRDYYHDLPEGQIWLRLLEIQYPDVCRNCKIIFLKNGNEKDLLKFKSKIRIKAGVEFFRVKYKNKHIVTCLTPIHTSDEKDLEKELKILQFFSGIEDKNNNYQ